MKFDVIKGKLSGAKKVVIYGPEGIGKTTIAAKFPDPLFIDTEGSTKELDVNRLPVPTSWQMLLDEVSYVIDNPDLCKTLVVDTADWAEALCVAKVCDSDDGQTNNMKGLEKFGYGKGYRYAVDEFGRLINLLTDLVNKGVNVVLTAHAQMRKFEQPDEIGSYDRWEMKLINTQKCSNAAMIKEWADMVLFATYKTHTVSVSDDGKKKKASGRGQRVIYTTHHSCWDAKNRYGLSEELPLDYKAIAHIFEGQAPVKPSEPPKKAPEKKADKPAELPKESPKKELLKEEPKDAPKEPLTPPKEEPKRELDVDLAIPKELRDLMMANDVHEWELQAAVEAKGYFPGDMPIREYPQDFIKGVLIGAWEQVFAVVQKLKSNEEIPF